MRVDKASTTCNCARTNSRGSHSPCTLINTCLPDFSLILAQTVCLENNNATPQTSPIAHLTGISCQRHKQQDRTFVQARWAFVGTPLLPCCWNLAGSQTSSRSYAHARDHAAAASALTAPVLTRAYPTSLALKLIHCSQEPTTPRTNPHQPCRRRRTPSETRPRLHTYMRIAAPLASALHEQRQRP